jgi:hypothetical protein
MLFLTGLGYLGAAVSYSYLMGINAQTPIVCPVCPNLTSLGPPLHKFVSFALVLGTLNAVFFLLVGWLVSSLVRFSKRSISN